jgi:hypothetical protein
MLLSAALASEGITSKLVAVQNLIYRIDNSIKLGKGSYGSVVQCESLQLIDQCITTASRNYCFKRKTLAVKQLTLTPE